MARLRGRWGTYAFVAVVMLGFATMGWWGGYGLAHAMGLSRPAAAFSTSMINAGWWLWVYISVRRPPAWLRRRRARAIARKMAWPDGWKGFRWLYPAIAVWAAIQLWMNRGDFVNLIIQWGVIFWSLRCFRKSTGLRFRTLWLLRRARKAPWRGYAPGPLPCAQCKGTGMLPSRISPEVSYPCNVCRWRGVSA